MQQKVPGFVRGRIFMGSYKNIMRSVKVEWDCDGNSESIPQEFAVRPLISQRAMRIKTVISREGFGISPVIL